MSAVTLGHGWSGFTDKGQSGARWSTKSQVRVKGWLVAAALEAFRVRSTFSRMLGSEAQGEDSAFCFWEPLWYPVPRSCSVLLADTEDPCAKASGLSLRPTDGVPLFPAQCHGCQLGTAECQRDSQRVGKQASSDCCLGVAVLTYRFLYRECLLI